MKSSKIYFENLSKVNSLFSQKFNHTYKKFLSDGKYILGTGLLNFEKMFAKYINKKYCIGVGNGLDALTISLKALNLPKNSEIIVASNAYIACIMSIINANLKPILVEPDIKTYNINPELLEDSITKKTKGIMAVHMYGKPCDMSKITKICKVHNLFVIEDCSQSHGASINNKKLGSYGEISCFSFYPTKNLGALGDGGAILCNSRKLYNKIKMMRNYGSIKKYTNSILGVNSRLDEFQALFLSSKIKYLDKINNHKIKLAKIYDKKLSNKFIKPIIAKNEKHVFHIYNIRHPKRDKIRLYLQKNNIFTDIHYPIPPHKQLVFKNLFKKKYPISEEIHKTTLSLPISFSLKKKDIETIIKVLNKF